MTTTLLPDPVFEVLCDDSEFVLSRLQDSPDGPSRLGRPAATGLDLATVIEAQRARELAAANEELRRTLDAIPHAITILGPDGKTLGANAFTLDYTGLSLDEIKADDSASGVSTRMMWRWSRRNAAGRSCAVNRLKPSCVRAAGTDNIAGS